MYFVVCILPVIAVIEKKYLNYFLKKCNLYFVIEIHFKSNWSNSVGMITTQLGDRSYTGRRDVCGYGWSETVTCGHGDCAFNQNWDMIRQNATLIKHIRIQHNMHVITHYVVYTFIFLYFLFLYFLLYIIYFCYFFHYYFSLFHLEPKTTSRRARLSASAELLVLKCKLQFKETIQ